MSVTDIAFACGFESSQYFATVFKKKTNSCPTSYRTNSKPIREIPAIKQKHIKIEALNSRGDVIEIVGFNIGKHLAEIKESGIIDIIAEIELNVWNGNKKIQLLMRDYKKNEK